MNANEPSKCNGSGSSGASSCALPRLDAGATRRSLASVPSAAFALMVIASPSHTWPRGDSESAWMAASACASASSACSLASMDFFASMACSAR